MSSKQQWAVGQSVQLGGRTLLVTGRAEKRAKGEAAPWLLETGDGSRAYEWVPFRGLKLVRGDLVRPQRAARRQAQRQAARTLAKGKGRRPRQQVRAVTNKGLWARLTAHFRKPVKRVRNRTITRPPGAAIGPQPRQG